MKPVVRSVTLKSFRSFASERVFFDNPTFLVGQNGAGKSNLVDALAFLSEAMAEPLHTVITRRGGLGALSYRLDSPDQIPSLGLAIELADVSPDISTAQYALELYSKPQQGFQVKQEQCFLVAPDGKKSYFIRSEDEEYSPPSVSSFANLLPSTYPDALALPLVGGHKAFAPVVRALASIRAYSIEPARLRDLQDPNGHTALKSDGSNAASVLQSIIRDSPEDAEQISEFLTSILPYKTEVHPVTLGTKVSMEFMVSWAEKHSITLGANSMSEGTLRLLGLLLAVLQRPAPTLLMLEEPESTIHPGALGAVLDLIRVAAYRSQVLVTTHSPELLDATRWIEDHNLRVVYWADGSTHVSPIGKASRETLQEHLMGAGELLRSNVLDAPPVNRQDLDYSLFETPV